MRTIFAAAALFTVASLAACSGSGGGDSVPELQGKAGSYATAMAKGFAANRQITYDDRAQADCAARRWIGAMGIGIFEDKGIAPAGLEDPDYHYDDLGLDRRQAEQLVDAHVDCGVDLYADSVKSLTATSGGTTSTSCARRYLTDEVMRDYLVSIMSGTAEKPATEKAFTTTDEKCAN